MAERRKAEAASDEAPPEAAADAARHQEETPKEAIEDIAAKLQDEVAIEAQEDRQRTKQLDAQHQPGRHVEAVVQVLVLSHDGFGLPA